jgi:hypothetical protein
VTPLELAIVLSAVGNASGLFAQVQEGLAGLAKAGESTAMVARGMSFTGGLIRTSGNAVASDDRAPSATSLLDKMAQVNIALPATAEGDCQISGIRESAIAQSHSIAHAALQVPELEHIWLSGFRSTRQAMVGTSFEEQVAIETQDNFRHVMRTLSTLHLYLGDTRQLAERERHRLSLVMISARTQFAFTDIGERIGASRYAIATTERLELPLNNATAEIGGLFADGLHVAEAGWALAGVMMNATYHGVIDKLGVPVARATLGVSDPGGTLHNLAERISARLGFQAAHQLTKAFGIRRASSLNLLSKFGSALELAASGCGTLTPGAAPSWAALARADRSMAALSGPLEAPLGPSGLAPLAIGAIALARYDIYKHQSALKAVIRGAVDDPQTPLNALRPFVKNAGRELESYEHIDQTKEAAGKVAHALARSSVGCSPIYGLLDEVNLSRTIAMTPRPDVLMPATRNMTPETTAAKRLTAVAGGRVTINLTYSPTLKDESPDEWVRGARRHADELVRIIDAKLSRRARLEFA